MTTDPTTWPWDHIRAVREALRETYRLITRGSYLDAQDALNATLPALDAIEAALRQSEERAGRLAAEAEKWRQIAEATELTNQGLYQDTEVASLTHDDACRLSRAFNENANLTASQDYRINEWLKRAIARAALAREATG